jgi:FixJ family two-component response regulator
MTSKVHVVDDDAAVRGGLKWFFESAGLVVDGYVSAEDFLAGYAPGEADECVVLDLSMPGLSGLQLFETFVDRGWTVPVIFLTGQAKVPDAVEALKRGAFDFLEKPFADEALLARVRAAHEEDRRRRMRSEEEASVVARLGGLTQREHQVALRVAAGQPNKVIAAELGISPRTVEVYRAKAMSKTGARSVADLVQLVMRQPSAAS